jgi:hypothetical protein
VKVSLIGVVPVEFPVTTAPNKADAGGVSAFGVGLVTMLAALAVVALQTSAAAPAAAMSIFRIADLLFIAQVYG